MSSESRRSGLECEAVSLDTGKVEWIFMLSYRRIQQLGQQSNRGELFRAAHLVRLALKQPTGIFRGIRFEEDELHSCHSPAWLCYCCCPPIDFTRAGVEISAPPKMVFLVFVSEDKTVYNWGWERADLDAWDAGKRLPVNYQNRFQEHVI